MSGGCGQEGGAQPWSGSREVDSELFFLFWGEERVGFVLAEEPLL